MSGVTWLSLAHATVGDVNARAQHVETARDLIATHAEMRAMFGLSEKQVDDLWGQFRTPELKRASSFLEHCRAIMRDKAGLITAEVIGSAREIAAAINALPVGKDIRTRLLTQIDQHVELLSASGGAK